MSNKIINNSIKTLILLASTLVLAATANAGSWRSETTIGGKLQTHVYVPTSAPAVNGKRALMVTLHGCSQSGDDFRAGSGWDPIAEQYGMVVALPTASGEGTYGWLKCWNFHVGMNASRTSSDPKYLIDMVNALIADTSLNIDPDQVYITGLSSGAGMTSQIACLAPDVFAGAGVNAGPAPGSNGSTGDLNNPAISATQGRSNCNNLAGSFQNHLYTQLHNNVHGSNDGSVSPAHAQRNTEIFDLVYEQDGSNISTCSTSTLPGNGDVTTLCDGTGPRISKVIVNGMGHAWPAGPDSSGGGNYIDHSHVNYPEYIADFFITNNRRTGGSQPTPTPTPTGTATPTPTPTATPTPTPTPTPDCNEYTSNNVTHVSSGRANVVWGSVYAKGSNDYMGLYNIFTTRTLAETSSGHYEVGNCP
ncbi:MAG: PHB depolymerase family esterase [Agarilytica sp.]